MSLRDKPYTITETRRYLSDGPYFQQDRLTIKRIAILRELENKPYFVYRLDKDGYIEWDATVIFRSIAKEWKMTYIWLIAQGTINLKED